MDRTNHARQRMQQRNVPSLLLELLAIYGRERARHGALVRYFDHRGKLKARQALEDVLERFDKLADAYMVEANDSGAIITTGYRRARIQSR